MEDLTTGDFNRVMIVGKGSLFLGRMTNLFDGVSIIIERNSGETAKEEGVSEDLKSVIKAEVANALRNFAQSLGE